MKVITLFMIMLIPVALIAQYDRSLPEPVPSNAHLFSLNDQVILIHPMDMQNKSDKWVLFDSSLNITATRKLTTPYAEDILSQNYLQSDNVIFRIDQFLLDGQLHVNAYTFNAKGDLINSKALDFSPHPGSQLLPVPFYISQSPGKKIISLMQAQVIADSLIIANVILDDQLNISSNTGFSIPFDAVLSDMYMPLVNNNETSFIITADKFDSYKLGSVVNCYMLHKGQKTPSPVHFKFNRKKIKDLNFFTPGDSLIFSALFSETSNKDVVSGILQTGYDTREQKHLFTKDYTYNSEIKSQLKKMYNSEGRKGNLLNYLSILPEQYVSDTSFGYAILLPAQKNGVRNIENNMPAPLPGLGQIQRDVAYSTQFIGTQPPGFSKPMDAAEASVYARSLQGNRTIDYEPNKINYKSAPSRKSKSEYRNLLYFSLNDSPPGRSTQFLRIKILDDPRYDFFTYIPGQSSYSAIFYSLNGSHLPFLNKITIDKFGSLEEKKLFEDNAKILLPGYPIIVNQEFLTGFYQDVNTRQMGLLKIKL